MQLYNPPTQAKPLLSWLSSHTGVIIFTGVLSFLFLSTATDASFLPMCTATGNCGACDLVNIFTRIGKFLILTTGGLALITIFHAGIKIIISGGKSDKIKNAKSKIAGAIIGLFLALGAFQVISFVILTITVPAKKQTSEVARNQNEIVDRMGKIQILGIEWWSICNEDV